MLQDRLLDIAVREFGAKGLEGASTRGIATAAGTAMSSITYHYRSKEGLYLAAADHIAAAMAADMGELDGEAQGAPADPGEARAAIHRIVARLLGKMADDGSADAALFILREQMNPTEAFDRLYAGMMGRILTTLVDLVCTATRARDLHASRIVTLTLLGQVLTVRASRGSCLRLLEQDTLSGDTLDAIRNRIAANTDAILDRLAADHDEKGAP